MTAEKCVVEGCNLEYDVVCSFSFYNVNTLETQDAPRQEWIDGAMHDESECLWRHVSLQLCGYHFELDSQGLWIDSPMLPELLTAQEKSPAKPRPAPSADDTRGGAKEKAAGYQGLFEQFLQTTNKVADSIKLEHNYSTRAPEVASEPVSRLNVRQLVDTLGYLSMKNLQRKQLWVVKVETDKAEASITQAEQVITKMQEPKQIIEIVPQPLESPAQPAEPAPADASDFIYEIAEEQEIAMDEVHEMTESVRSAQEWTVNIVPEETRPRYAFIKHTSSGKKKRHFTSEMNEVTLQGDFENYYILPDADPSVGVEVTTSYEPENYIVDEYQHLVLQSPQGRPRKRPKEPKPHDPDKKRKKKPTPRAPKRLDPSLDQSPDWTIDANQSYDQDESDDYDPKNKSRVRRKNNKYVGYEYVT